MNYQNWVVGLAMKDQLILIWFGSIKIQRFFYQHFGVQADAKNFGGNQVKFSCFLINNIWRIRNKWSFSHMKEAQAWILEAPQSYNWLFH